MNDTREMVRTMIDTQAPKVLEVALGRFNRATRHPRAWEFTDARVLKQMEALDMLSMPLDTATEVMATLYNK